MAQCIDGELVIEQDITSRLRVGTCSFLAPQGGQLTFIALMTSVSSTIVAEQLLGNRA